MTMIEYPAIGAHTETLLRENMIFQFPSAGRGPGWQSLPLHAGHLPRRQKRGRKFRERAMEILCRQRAKRESEQSMKICVVGCGAIGSIFGGASRRAAKASRCTPTTFRRSTSDAITQDGTAHFRRCGFHRALFTPPQTPKKFPSAITASSRRKARTRAGAIAQTAHIFNESSAVCSVQNGVGNEEIIAEQ